MYSIKYAQYFVAWNKLSKESFCSHWNNNTPGLLQHRHTSHCDDINFPSFTSSGEEKLALTSIQGGGSLPLFQLFNLQPTSSSCCSARNGIINRLDSMIARWSQCAASVSLHCFRNVSTTISVLHCLDGNMTFSILREDKTHFRATQRNNSTFHRLSGYPNADEQQIRAPRGPFSLFSHDNQNVHQHPPTLDSFVLVPHTNGLFSGGGSVT